MMKNSEICVPVKALALPTEGSGEVTPSVGDEVDISGTATVSRIEGDNAYLVPKTINGETIEAAEEKKPQDLDEEEDEMRDDAAKTDRERIY